MTAGSCSRAAVARTRDIAMPMRFAACAVGSTRGTSLPLTASSREGPSSLAASLSNVDAFPQPAIARAATIAVPAIRRFACSMSIPPR